MKSWKKPTLKDYFKIQKYLSRDVQNFNAEYFDDYRLARLKNFKIIDKTFERPPELKVIPLNVPSSNRDVCIITYASANDTYSFTPLRLLKSLRQNSYRGHFIFQIGGCPNLEENSLQYVDTPYAFKINMFREAMKLGFKHIIWIDSTLTISSKSNLNYIISEIKSKGSFFVTMGINLFGKKKIFKKVLMEDKAIPTLLDCTLNNIDDYIHINTKIIGLNMSHKANRELIFLWQEAAKKKTPFLTITPEEIPFSLLLKKLNMPCKPVGFIWIFKHFPVSQTWFKKPS